jgi:hypothetical protein
LSGFRPYTKKSLYAAQNSIELTKTSRQIEHLPRMNFIIHVTFFLGKWNDELKMIIKYLKDGNTKEIIKISNRDIVKPDGLIDEYLFEKMPNWLSVIYESGAQYYYNSSCLYKNLWSEERKKINSEDPLDRFQESSYYIEVLLKYVKDEMPEVFLNCPASLNTNDFFKKI